MGWTSYIGPAVIAAIVSGVVAAIGFVVNRSTLMEMHRQRLATDQRLAETKMQADIDLAERKFRLDRDLADWRRKTEMAEQVLADFYKARELFRSSRTAAAFGGEGLTRPDKRADETEVESRIKDAIYAPLERITKEMAFLSEMHARRFRFMALFGNNAAEPFLVFVRSFNTIHHASWSLLRNRLHLASDMKEHLEAVIGWGDEDPIMPGIDQAIADIEKTCRPVLQTQLD